MRTAHEMGIATVAVYADDDADAPVRARGRRGGGPRRPATPRRPTSTWPRCSTAAAPHGRRRRAPRLRLPVRERRLRPRGAPTPGWSGSARRPRPSRAMGDKLDGQAHGHRRRRAHPAHGHRPGRRRRPSAIRCWSRPRPAAAARACAWSSDPAALAEAVAAAEPRGPVGLRRRHRVPGALREAAPATSRCRCWATPTARSSTWASANAPSSAATRRSWRRRRRRPSTRRAARQPRRRRGGHAAAAVGYSQRRHGRVPVRRRPRASSSSSR